MIEAIQRIFDYIVNYPFVRYTIVVAVLIALCAALLGVTLVLKRFSMIGDGLSHVAFGAMAVGAVVGLTNNLYIVLPVTVISAILLLKSQESKRIKGDALVAMLSVSALAIGYILMNKFKTTNNVANDACVSLFGSTAILTLSMTDVWISIGLSAFVILFMILFHNKLFAVTFDESFARASGTKTSIYDIAVAIIIAVVVVVAMKLVGSLLVSALVIFPALSAMRVFRSFKGVTIASAIISVICALFGLFSSMIWETPVGPTIIIFDIAAFLIFFIIGLILSRTKKA